MCPPIRCRLTPGAISASPSWNTSWPACSRSTAWATSRASKGCASPRGTCSDPCNTPFPFPADAGAPGKRGDIARVVVVHVGHDDVLDALGGDADLLEQIHRRGQIATPSPDSHVRREPGINQQGPGRIADHPHIEVQRHRGIVMRVLAQIVRRAAPLRVRGVSQCVDLIERVRRRAAHSITSRSLGACLSERDAPAGTMGIVGDGATPSCWKKSAFPRTPAAIRPARLPADRTGRRTGGAPNPDFVPAGTAGRRPFAGQIDNAVDQHLPGKALMDGPRTVRASPTPCGRPAGRYRRRAPTAA